MTYKCLVTCYSALKSLRKLDYSAAPPWRVYHGASLKEVSSDGILITARLIHSAMLTTSIGCGSRSGLSIIMLFRSIVNCSQAASLSHCSVSRMHIASRGHQFFLLFCLIFPQLCNNYSCSSRHLIIRLKGFR